jgi:hypothetical protein
MEYKNGILSSADLSGLVMTDRDTAFLAIGTAFGGLQTPVLRRVLNEPLPVGTGIFTSTPGLAALLVGSSFIGIGVAARTDAIPLNKDVATFMLGYGISVIVSLLINYFSQAVLVTAISAATPSSTPA